MTGSKTASSAAPDSVELLRQDRDRFVRLAFCSADLLFEVDSTHVVTFAAGAAQHLLGKAPEDLIGRPFVELFSPADTILMSELMTTISPGARVDPLTVRFNGPDGPTGPLWLSGYRLPDAPGDYLFGLRIGGPVTGIAQASQDLLDPESGLLNKEAFADFADQQIREAGERGEVLRMTMLHADDFAGLRSRLDPEDARNAFQSMGACLKANSSGGQAAGQFNDTAYGFLHKPGLDVEKITSRIEEIFEAADPTGAGISVGSGTIDADVGGAEAGDSVRVLLYTVNRFCEMGADKFNMSDLADNLKAMTSETSTRLSEFRTIVQSRNFELAFQPIVALDTREIHHYEVLARFGKEIGWSPYELLSFAESTGVIAEFDLAMTKCVIDWLQRARGKGPLPTLAVNLSGQSITDEDFIASHQLLLKGIEGAQPHLVFELTESSRIDDLETANRSIQMLRSAGHKVCLDDFGAGSAALRYLHALEVDVVKIDGQYVRSAMESPRNRAFLHAIASLCRELGVETVAEFIEDEATAAMLVECRVEFGQGYLFGKPSFDISDFGAAPAAAPPDAQPAKKRVASDKLKVARPQRPDVPENGVQMILPDQVIEANRQQKVGKKPRKTLGVSW